MIRWVVGTSLRFRFIVVALGLGLTFFGAQRLKDIPIDVFPEFAPPWIEVQTLCLGLSPAEVEEQVTVPIENAMNGVPGVEICDRVPCPSSLPSRRSSRVAPTNWPRGSS